MRIISQYLHLFGGLYNKVKGTFHRLHDVYRRIFSWIEILNKLGKDYLGIEH